MVYILGSRGSLQGVPHYYINNAYPDWDEELQQIKDFPTRQPATAVVNEIDEEFCLQFKEQLKGRLVLITSEFPSEQWNLFDWVILRREVNAYKGEFANEVWLTWSEVSHDLSLPRPMSTSIRFDVAPYTKGKLSELVAWVCRQSVPMTVSL